MWLWAVLAQAVPAIKAVPRVEPVVLVMYKILQQITVAATVVPLGQYHFRVVVEVVAEPQCCSTITL
jgi:hypothetical protein